MDDRMRERRALEVRRARQRRRRQQQIIRRTCLAVAAALVLVITAAVSLSRIRKTQAGETVKREEMQGGPQTVDTTYEDLKDPAGGDGAGEKEPVNREPVEEEPEEICVVVDPGHGGKDPGTLWEGSDGEAVYEKDINLEIALKLEALLKEAGYKVVMTREGDTYPNLSERVQVAAKNQADVFVSIHQNAVDNSTTITGMEIYCNEASNRKSPDLANAIFDAVLANTGAKSLGVVTDSDFVVVENNTMPACLIETGFLTTPGERKKLLDDDYQEEIARGILEGINQFFEENPVRS